jgi:hypothetical protein
MRWPALLAGLASALMACDDSGSSGLEADLRISGAQFVAGALPGVDPGAPAVTAVSFGYSTVNPGTIQHHIQGRIGAGGQAVAIQLRDDVDVGYWIVPGGIIDIFNNGEVTFDAQLSYSPLLPLGTTQLIFSAVGSDGHFGEHTTADINLVAEEADQMLDVRLTWDTQADLDLHLQLPDGRIIWAHQATSSGGLLDADSNGGCVIDGRRKENVGFASPPPSGGYVVRVDAASMCGQPAARWKVEVLDHGQVISQASGWLGPDATRGAHDAGAGVLALTFEVQ